ncbi:hypothetical protein OGAPHI_002765 [Ogataea philodendri]|uniref:Uncharacterized protein n=1 Tax=Ogataea philodendri TaxID=1378263 RepID=A0A9P8PCD6_9ASCO|nr:uncharacterized protein OGAPHI_002765 [Ogataea philodendri]KAH3669010.1 hypothetical protein OGAPHI_002765 [Ogataea philodendri]
MGPPDLKPPTPQHGSIPGIDMTSINGLLPDPSFGTENRSPNNVSSSVGSTPVEETNPLHITSISHDDGITSLNSDLMSSHHNRSSHISPVSSVSSANFNDSLLKPEYSDLTRLSTSRLRQDSNKWYFVPPDFLSNKTHFPYLSDIQIPREISNYTFYTECSLKLQFYMMNTMPFRICEDATNRELLISVFKTAPLYDFCWHSFMAIACIDLYHQQEMYNHDDVLNLDKNTYLKMGDFHFSKSVYSMSKEVKVQEDCNKAIALIETAMLHIFYATATPSQSIATRSYLGLGRNLGLLFTEYVLQYRSHKMFNDACARYCINSWSQDASYYFPEFLYDLADVSYPSTGEPNKMRVLSLDEEDKLLICKMVDRLKKEYRSFANVSLCEAPAVSTRHVPIESILNYEPTQVGSTCFEGKPARSLPPSQKLEYDMFGTLSRYIVEVPERIIDMVDAGDPRALILTAYNLLGLATRQYKYWPSSVYTQEIKTIERLLDRSENSQLWKSWLDVPKQVFNELHKSV